MSLELRVFQQPEDILVFGEDAVVKVRLWQKMDLINGGLPETMLEAVVRSQVPLQLQKEQKLEIHWGAWHQATAYTAECVRLSQQLYRIRGKARLEYLQVEFLGGIYDETPVESLLQQMMENRECELDIPVTGRLITGYLPRSNRQEALRQLCFSLGAVLGINSYGQLWLRMPELQELRVLQPGRILGDVSLQMLPEYTRFELAAHSYTKGELRMKLRDRAEYPKGILTLYFPSPYYNYYAEAEDGAYVEDEGPNYVVVAHHGNFTLYAYPYVKETTYYTAEGVTSQDPDYSLVQTVRDVTLVNDQNVQTLLERMKSWGQLRMLATVTYGAEPGEEVPQAGDPVELPTPWGTVLRGFVKKSDMLLENDTFKLELTILCKEVS